MYKVFDNGHIFKARVNFASLLIHFQLFAQLFRSTMILNKRVWSKLTIHSTFETKLFSPFIFRLYQENTLHAIVKYNAIGTWKAQMYFRSYFNVLGLREIDVFMEMSLVIT